MWTILWLDEVPFWGLYAATVVMLLISSEIGFQLGCFRYRFFRKKEEKSQAGAIMTAALSLLALILAFTFSMAAFRFADRKQLVVEEANAIGTAYLRTLLFSEPQSTLGGDLLRQYVDVRLEIAKTDNPRRLKQIIIRSEELHTQLWSQVVSLAKKHPDSILVGLYIQSLNEVIDLHAKRVAAGIRNRIPVSVWFTLYLVASLSMIVMGYHGGLTCVRSTITTIALVLIFSAVMLLIIDLDRPYQTLFTVSQEAMFDLQKHLNRRGSWNEILGP